ncbi:MAG: chromosome segregation protein SMC [Bacteroidia bacterium]|nr:chromosome segregation protein SMC [Bacteroidia bacterium]
MQLKSLEIYGFKSFADKTKFFFDKGITGVVGPNGCGKSNIVDAIRWALGEQKTKNLRSEKMENIIFNGTEKRKRANFAEVSLTFENTKNILPTDYHTVTISRKFYRSGDGEYYLNGVACRLKDIQNLFLDTGIGSDSYAIIELKMVDEILNDKENSRRNLFEEAAGISKYKIRKKQTLKRLEDTSADLERVEDILFEIDKNLKALEKQAKKAEKYFELKEKYKLVSSRHAWFKIRELRVSYEEVEKEEKAFADRLGEIQSRIAKHEARIQELRKEQVDNERILSEAQKDLNAHVDKIKTIETEKSIKNERLKYLQQREFAISNQMESEKKTRERLAEELVGLQETLGKVQEEFSVKEKRLARLKANLDELRGKNEELKGRTDELAAEYRQAEQELQKLEKDREIKGIQISSLMGELQRTEADKDSRSTELNSFASNLGELEKELKGLENEVNTLRQKKQENDREREETAQAIVETKDGIYKTSRGLDARLNEFNLTKSLVENLEGFPESVKFLKKEAKWVKDAPLVSDVFNATEPYKVAFENLLEPYLSYYIVPTRTDALAAVKLLSDAAKGRANFFVLDELADYQTVKTQEFPGAQPALGLIEFGEDYQKLAEYLLDQVYMVENDLDLPENIPGELVFITQSGTMSRKRYSLGGGSIGLFQGKRLGRAKNLEKLDKEIRKFEKELNKQKTDLDKLEKHQEALKQLDFSKDLEAKNNVFQQKKQALSILMTREQEYRDFIRQAGERTEVIQEKISNLTTELEGIEPRIVDLKKDFSGKSAILEEYQLMLRSSNTELSEESQAYNQENIATIQLKNRLDNLQRDETQKVSRIRDLDENEKKLSGELEQTRKDIHGLVTNNLQNDEEIIALYEARKVKEERTEKFEQIASSFRNSISQQEEFVRKERKNKEEAESKKDEIKDRVTEIKIALNSLKERMSVEFELDISDLDEEIIFEGGPEQYNQDEVEEEMLRVRGKIQGYGEINPMAVEAYNEMKERFDFINVQKKDLLEAKTTLLNTINEIDGTATDLFNQAFSQIRDNFKKVFQGLFREGDTCDLQLTEPSNPLDSKIDINAKPKGKRPLTINQLSGGEKTLTAISLLFAIYLLKPAPFCIFDEVDAPLDDANIDKFNQIIRQFSAESQFILVTHNKRTMAATNVMYGVTMENTGVSKVLPVDLMALNLADEQN